MSSVIGLNIKSVNNTSGPTDILLFVLLCRPNTNNVYLVLICVSNCQGWGPCYHTRDPFHVHCLLNVCVQDELLVINSLLILGCLDFKMSAYWSYTCNQQQNWPGEYCFALHEFHGQKEKNKTKQHEIPKMCICGPVLVKWKNNVLKGIGSGMCAPNIRGWRRHPGAEMGWWCGVSCKRNPCLSWVPRMLAFSQWLTPSMCQSPLRDREGGGRCRGWTYLSNEWGR